MTSAPLTVVSPCGAVDAACPGRLACTLGTLDRCAEASESEPVLAASPLDVVCPGVDRIVWMSVDVREGEPRGGLVHGIRHRRPVEVAVDADSVRRLLAAGVPARPRRCEACTSATAGR